MDLGLTGARCLVSGGSVAASGRAIAHGLAAEGARVAAWPAARRG
jgi:NAD(P)-dependent dehydrogenase (short-subunit alcohol dehydrogenase family)